ncbi:MAG: hypothetical protein K1X44_07280 [Alphaproteobacteria bacterium]|nr:hypothetical protein [Alphaproteobacteria bacterium]
MEPQEYKFKIDAYTPDTLPMDRLAEYLMELSKLLGENPYVHFMRLEAGSTVIVQKIDSVALPKVRARTEAIKRGDAQISVMQAYKCINDMLKEDNTTGVLLESNNAEIIRFPGTQEKGQQIMSVRQQGEISGEVIRVGGKKEDVPILLDIEGKEISGCYAKREIAKVLGKHLFEPVRLFGIGKWNRNSDGEWNLFRFDIDNFEVLENISLSKSVFELRTLRGEWGSNALHELLELRNENNKAH